ncbi:MAG TPA: YCF48-related protein [Candidatus Kapabacteria bacterium]|nr:YCF48-related protein [Candidatus Kapabacteria bacterium]
MKFVYTLVLLIIITCSQSSAKYWQKIENIPAPYNNNYWLDVFFLPSNPNYGWVCGFKGMILRTSDGGNTWNGAIAPDAYHLEHIHFPSKNVGYTSGPDGIWKSTDGGMTWKDVTPNALNPEFWGCYFLDDELGVLVGGGCVSNQSFYKTTDGGSSWTVFNSNEPNSGLTDVILYNSGEGYASSSGVVWKTNDFGSTWSIFSMLGSKLWQEEINKFANSFLVPYSGFDCQGGGNNGGAKFSTDNGFTWLDKNTGVSMFGSFLLSPLKGWACGNQDNVIYTSDGGINWQDKDCGLEVSDYDDMWFVDENNGWVVGAGVYHLAPSTYPINKDTILIDNVCIGQSGRDTIWINNNSFDKSTGRILIPSSKEIYLYNTPKDFLMEQCSFYPIIINYTAFKDTTITFNFDLIINEPASDNKTYNVTVILKTLKSTSFPQFSNIKIDSVQVDNIYNYSLNIYSESNQEFLINYTKLSGSPNINIKTKLPIPAYKNGNHLDFEILATDTGWVSAKYKLQFDRCNSDTIIEIKAYAYSPIIQSIEKIDKLVSCEKIAYDTVDVFNYGNSDLIIATYSTKPIKPDIKILGFVGESVPVVIAKNKSKKLIIQSSPNTFGSASFELLLINNDVTKIRGIKNPYRIIYNLDYKKPKIQSETVIDFGRICKGRELTLPLKLFNLGNLDGTVYLNKVLNQPFSFSFKNKQNSEVILAGDSLETYLTFMSNIPGDFIDTLELRTSPCNEIHTVVIKGSTIGSEIEVIPSKIDTTFKAGDTIEVIVRISAIERDIIIEKIFLSNNDPNWYIKPEIVLPLVVVKGQAAIFRIKFSTNIVSTLNSILVFENSSICDTLAFVDVNLSTFSKFVSVGPNILDFGKNLCNLKDTVYSVSITNKGIIPDTLESITISSKDFDILNMPKLPYIMSANEIFKLQVKFNPKVEGAYIANINIATVSPGSQNFTIDLKGEYFKSQIVTNKLLIDFGFIEQCQTGQLDSIIFRQLGMLEDTLELINLSDDSFVKINDNNTILPFELNNIAILKLSLIQDSLELGENEMVFHLRSKYCNNQFEVVVKANLVTPRLLINPKPLDFETNWIGTSKILPLELNNSSNIDIDIIAIELNSNEFECLSSLNINIPANSIVNLPIKFTALSEGKKDINIKLIYRTNCIDSTSGILLADVPKEEYKAQISIGDYISEPDSIITMAIHSDYILNNLDLDSIKFEIHYDRKLFYPQEVFFGGSLNNENISFDKSFGNLTIKVKGEESKKIFEKSGDIIFIRGKVLMAVPDSTPLDIYDVELGTSKNIELTTIDGSLKVVDFCHELTKFEFQFIPTFTPKVNNIINNNILNYSISATKETTVNVSLTNAIGEIIDIGEHKVYTTNSNFYHNLYNISNGLYYMNFRNQFWSKTYKILIVK